MRGNKHQGGHNKKERDGKKEEKKKTRIPLWGKPVRELIMRNLKNAQPLRETGTGRKEGIAGIALDSSIREETRTRG